VAGPESLLQPGCEGLLPSLREALAEGKASPATILHAVADAARVLIDADGVAIAVRTKALVVCRARSGDIAPDLGSPLSADSGISGECLRTATILLCNDAETDPRVDPDVCRVLGIRSIVAVPLRGPMGIAGILEAFSARASAFAGEQINALRELAQIAEAAYERECRFRDEAPARFRSATRRELLAAIGFKETAQPKQQNLSELLNEPSRERRYWLIVLSAIAVLLVAGVVWLSWRDPTPEVAASDVGPQPAAITEDVSHPTPVHTVVAKPEAGTARHLSPRPENVLRNAAEVQPANADSDSIRTTITASERPSRPKPPSPSELAAVAPPAVDLAASSASKLPNLAAASVPMPALAVRISQGITQGVLIHKVAPVYPPQARMERIDGSVILDATIAENGIVKTVKIVSGPPQLAAAARDAVRQWRYSPPLLNGSPIEIQKQITVVFKLP